MSQPSITLLELGTRIKNAVAAAFDLPVWVTGEISDVRMHRNGHCYLELIQKDEASNQVVARMRATIWASTFRIIKPYFESTTRQSLSAGMKILVRGTPEYQEVYGLNFNVINMDATYTLGDMARRRMEVIARLQAEGVFDMNRELELPVVLQRIAVISSPTAAGYEDFLDQLRNNRQGIRFYVKLFPAIMQGERAEASIIEALGQVYEHEDFFDCVAIMRGGGASADLVCFDGYDLALHVAQFPLPVLTGIGHDRDESVADMVAHTQLKTPTAVAEFIIHHAMDFEQWLDQALADVTSAWDEYLDDAHDRLERAAGRFVPLVQQHLERQRGRLMRFTDQLGHRTTTALTRRQVRLHQAGQRLQGATGQRFGREQVRLLMLRERLQRASLALIKNRHQHLNFLDEKMRLHDPVNILNRGFSVTYCNGRVVKHPSDVKSGDVLTTLLKSGAISSIVD
ncbi:exodeoxyribonuclease VII large subunit [Breznakibacter xylanolyticus]|uniref:Exodeoxyribonuclease 7 large subunit n=1 Tax=Breznakibacter xylanolyticus TaxID=990 RepID=A0A2W7NNK1_9BACT|nr:exodeoxyribonuclease VII large subunit [Breznakibacter xylanolyticus]PZX12842.1 exodeoxyribonuclease VII large subunit [Breznakibacter xylanolyticus]